MLRAIAILLLTASPAFAEPAKRCDAAELEAQGTNLLHGGREAEALFKYEAAARCKPNDGIHLRIVYVACRLYVRSRGEQWAAKVKHYAAKLPAHKRDQALQMCRPGCGGDGLQWRHRD
jgi:hypothetical protein